MTKFRDRVLNRSSHHKFKVTNSRTSREMYRKLKKEKSINIEEKTFMYIIKSIHKWYVNQLLTGHDIKFPCNMGIIELRRVKKTCKIINGQYGANYAVDWNSTLNLWETDEESYNNKTLIRFDSGISFFIKYPASKRKYNNKIFYSFIPTRKIKIALKNKINDNEIDAYELY